MATEVRIHYYNGLSQLPVVTATKFQSDSVVALSQPYLSRQRVTASSTAQSTSPAPTGSRIAVVEVEDGKKVRFEVNFGARATPADQDSPLLFGTNHLHISDGQTLSIIETT